MSYSTSQRVSRVDRFPDTVGRAAGAAMIQTTNRNSVSDDTVGSLAKKSARKHWPLVGLAGVMAGLVCGMIGIEVGADTFGNFLPRTAAGTNTGWEVGGQLGLVLGFVSGALAGTAAAYYLLRRAGRMPDGKVDP